MCYLLISTGTYFMCFVPCVCQMLRPLTGHKKSPPERRAFCRVKNVFLSVKNIFAVFFGVISSLYHRYTIFMIYFAFFHYFLVFLIHRVQSCASAKIANEFVCFFRSYLVQSQSTDFRLYVPVSFYRVVCSSC